MTCVLACDLGGSGFRAALIDELGEMQASHFEPLPVQATAGGASEIDPERWWTALAAAAVVLADAAPQAFSDVRAIAISAMARTQVFVDSASRSVRPAILWPDTRAGTELASLRARIDLAHPEAAQLNAYHPLARLWWLARTEPQQFSRIAFVLEPKDFLHLRLTGAAATDTISMARLLAAAQPGLPGASGTSLLQSAGLSSEIIPPRTDPVSMMGQVQAGLPDALGRLAGVPVVSMANDTWASVVGLGAMKAAIAYNLSGTTEVFGVLSETAGTADGLLSVDWGSGLTQIGGPSLAGGDTVAWLTDLFASAGVGPQATSLKLDVLLSERRAAEPLVFVPYLRGERVPHWDPSLRGAWLGLHRSHTAVDLAYAVLEGVACLNRLVLEKAEAASGQAVREVRFGGGGSVNPIWCQIKADVLNRPVCVTGSSDQGLAGAAIVAWTALGHFANLAAAQERLVNVTGRYVPNAAQKLYYDEVFDIFRAAEESVKPVSHMLAALGNRMKQPAST